MSDRVLFQTREFENVVRLEKWPEGLVFIVGGEICWRSFDWPRTSDNQAKADFSLLNARRGIRIATGAYHNLADSLLPRIAQLERQNADLQAANTALLERARSAEEKLR